MRLNPKDIRKVTSLELAFVGWAVEELSRQITTAIQAIKSPPETQGRD